MVLRSGQRVGLLQPLGGSGCPHVPGLMFGNCVVVVSGKKANRFFLTHKQVDGVIPPPAKIQSIKALRNQQPRSEPPLLTSNEAREIFDSRGNPTVEVDLVTNVGDPRDKNSGCHRTTAR